MSDTPIFDDITVDLPEDHAIFWLDPAAVLDMGTSSGESAEDSFPEESSSDDGGEI